MNFKLKMAIDQARFFNMPKENIERAIKGGTGELKDAAQIEEIMYEAYGPGNVAMLIKCATDNRNRTVSEVKSILTKSGGKMANEGSVKFLFRQVGNIEMSAQGQDPYDLEMLAIEAGAEDTLYADGTVVVYTLPEDLQQVKESLEKAKVKIEGAGLVWAPLQKIQLDAEAKLDYEKLLEKLDENDDVQ